MKLRHLVVGLALIVGPAATATAAEPLAPDRDTRLTLLRGALAEASEAGQRHFELGPIEMLPPLMGFARSQGDRIEVNSLALDLFEDQAGARALAALLVTYVAPPPARASTSAGIAENVAVAGAVLGGMALDPHKSRDINLFDAQPVSRRASDPKAGARMLATLEKAHGCSGPLVKRLARASAAKDRDPATAELVYLARKATRDLGRIAYPPDFSCAAGS